MLSIATGHDTDYLTSQVAAGREGYYTGAVAAGEPPGVWSGAGADVLGLSDEVDADLMRAIYHRLADPRDSRSHNPASVRYADTLGEPHRSYTSAEDLYADMLAGEPDASPERRAEMRAEAQRDARAPVAFFDLTFSVQKSISVLAVSYERAAQDARAAGDLEAAARWDAKAAKVEEAVRAGNAAMLAHMADVAGLARVGHHGGGAGRWIDSHCWVVASFLQHDSRDHDPQLHIHNAVLNRQLCADGKWRALDGKAIHRERAAAAAIGERVMEAVLTELLGLVWEIRADGKAREIKGISQALLAQFSSRRAAITPKAHALIASFVSRFTREPSPAERDRIMRQATLATRAAKSHSGETVGERLDRWQAEASRATSEGLAAARDGAHTASTDHTGPEVWSVDAVCLRAVALAAGRKATWTRSDLKRAVSDCLPANLGLPSDEIREFLDMLTDQALAGAVRLTPAEPTHDLPDYLRREDGSSLYDGGKVLFAAPWQLAAERVLAERAAEDGAEAFTAAEAAAVVARCTADGRVLGADQSAAVRGVLTSGASLEVIQAPAGTGKSYVVGVLAEAWTDQTIAPHAGGARRVFGLATSQNAADVLAGEGLSATANIARWLESQGRLADGHSPDDEGWRLRADDLVVVDEAGMVDTTALCAIVTAARRVGAKVLLTGDAAQLGAVGAGGAFADLIGLAPTHELVDVRRFDAPWEGLASLRLRAGDAGVVGEYARRGRIVDGGTAEQTEEKASRMWLADYLAGRDAVLLAGTSASVERLNLLMRGELVQLGHVEEAGVQIGYAGTVGVAGVGDLVQARHNGRSLPSMFAPSGAPVNRDLYRVVGVDADGGLEVVRVAGVGGPPETGATSRLPAAYVARYVSLGYAGTVHSVQGRTVDTSHVVVGAGDGPAGVYVGMSRGRMSNVSYCVTVTVPAEEAPGLAHQAGEQDRAPRRSAGAVLAAAIARDPNRAEQTRSASTSRTVAEEQSMSVQTSVDRLSVEVAEVTAGRYASTLDVLAASGALTPAQRTLLAADGPGMVQLGRLLRRCELAGHDPVAVLTDATAGRPLAGARNPAHVLHGRIRNTVRLGDRGASLDSFGELIPVGCDAATRERLSGLADAGDDRRAALGARASAAPPSWAVAALGPVPDEPMAAYEWERKVGWAAAYRELAGWTDDQAPLGPPPAAALVEHRAVWETAHTALNLTEGRAQEADMSEGRLRNRVAAAEREMSFAPVRCDDQMDATAREVADRSADAVLWSEYSAAPGLAGSERVDLAKASAEAAAAAERLAALYLALDEVGQARAEHLAETAVSRDLGERAAAQLKAMGVELDAEPEVSSAEWFAAHREAVAAEDPHRDITPADVAGDSEELPFEAAGAETAVPDIREDAVRDPSEDVDDTPVRRVPVAVEVAAQRERAREAVAEHIARRDAEAREFEQWEREQLWHADDQSEVEAAERAHEDEDDDVLV